MVVSILAVGFLILVGFIAIIGYKTIIKGGPKKEEMNMEKCSVCRQPFDKQQLILRQIGDYKLLYFCRECILKLYADLGLKN
jgi:hypothetical protein